MDRSPRAGFRERCAATAEGNLTPRYWCSSWFCCIYRDSSERFTRRRAATEKEHSECLPASCLCTQLPLLSPTLPTAARKPREGDLIAPRAEGLSGSVVGRALAPPEPCHQVLIEVSLRSHAAHIYFKNSVY